MYSRKTTAVVAGKFMPFHNGHRSLIEKASLLADHVDVLLVVGENDVYDPRIRALSIYESFPYKNIRVHIIDDLKTDDNEDWSSEHWAKYTRQILGYTPGIVVASEPYGERWAKHMNTEFHMHDVARTQIPVSGTMCRANAYECREYLPPASKRYTLPRVVVLGAESTGTTTLTKALAEHYGTRWVPEFGHEIGLEMFRETGKPVPDEVWDDRMFRLISRGQDAREELEARNANGILICDTDSWATSVWYDYYWRKGVVTGQLRDMLREAGRTQAKKHALYIVTSPEGVEFEDDGTRTGKETRAWHHQQFIKALKRDGLPFVVVEGTEQERLDKAIVHIEKVIK